MPAPPPLREHQEEDEKGTLFPRRMGPRVGAGPQVTVPCPRTGPRGVSRHTRYQERLLRGGGLWLSYPERPKEGMSPQGGAVWGGWACGGRGLVQGVDAGRREIMEDIQEGHTGEEVSAGPVLPRGDAGPRYWAGRSGHRGGKMARDRAGSGAERLCGSDSQPRPHPGRQVRGALQAQADLPFQARRSGNGPQGPPGRPLAAHSFTQRTLLALLCARARLGTGDREE